MKICQNCLRTYPDSQDRCSLCNSVLERDRSDEDRPSGRPASAGTNTGGGHTPSPAQHFVSVRRDPGDAAAPRRTSNISVTPPRQAAFTGNRFNAVPRDQSAPRLREQRLNDGFARRRRGGSAAGAELLNRLPLMIAGGLLLILLFTHLDAIGTFFRVLLTWWIIGFVIILIVGRRFLQPGTMLTGSMCIAVIGVLCEFTPIGNSVMSIVTPVLSIIFVVLLFRLIFR